MAQTLQAKFLPGKVVATPGFMIRCDREYALTALAQHLCGEWGTLGKADWEANDDAVENGGRIMSVYALPRDPGDFWIITEADRSVTTFLLPSEY